MPALIPADSSGSPLVTPADLLAAGAAVKTFSIRVLAGHMSTSIGGGFEPRIECSAEQHS